MVLVSLSRKPFCIGGMNEAYERRLFELPLSSGTLENIAHHGTQHGVPEAFSTRRKRGGRPPIQRRRGNTNATRSCAFGRSRAIVDGRKWHQGRFAMARNVPVSVARGRAARFGATSRTRARRIITHPGFAGRFSRKSMKPSLVSESEGCPGAPENTNSFLVDGRWPCKVSCLHACCVELTEDVYSSSANP
jgi:hypothetical protein